MPSPDYTKFKAVTNIGDTFVMDELENNLKVYFDWAFLQIGGWFDVDIPTSGAFGGDFSQLRLVHDDSYTDGQVWQGARKDWVWETGVNYKVRAEVGVVDTITWDGVSLYSGILINGSSTAQSGDVFQITSITGAGTGFNADYNIVAKNSITSFDMIPTGTVPEASATGGNWQLLKNPQPVQVNVGGTPNSDLHINYPLGRVIFDTAQSTTATITTSYSYRHVQTYIADDAQWWKELQFKSFRPDDIHFTQVGQFGEWSIGGHQRIQLPAIVLETVSKGTSRGYELGNGALIVEQDVLFHIITEDRYTRNNLVDICRLENDRSIWLYDSDAVAEVTGFPLDHRGMRTGSNMYPDLVAPDGFRWKTCRFTNARVSEVETQHPQLYAGVVRITMEVIFGTI